MRNLVLILILSTFVWGCKTDATSKPKSTSDEVKKSEKTEVKKTEKVVEKKIEEKEEPKTGVRYSPKTEWAETNPVLLNPSKASEKAPKSFKVKFNTSQGPIIVEVYRKWAPNGADRFYNLVKIGYFEDIAFFRSVPKFMLQFGIHGDPKVSEKWSDANIKDDPNVEGASNKPGVLTFAMAGPNTRSTQFFLNLKDNGFLDKQGFPPIGKIVEGMDVLKKMNTEYGENTPDVQGKFQSQGNAFISKRFPNLDYIKSIELVK